MVHLTEVSLCQAAQLDFFQSSFDKHDHVTKCPPAEHERCLGLMTLDIPLSYSPPHLLTQPRCGDESAVIL